ncbi:AI-2E family transporter [Microbacterium pseudoresistens]|uniref:Putative PurR-regulated permease PerM n=1 Tax=Microbacterium pseudoresistens TaxID=640634 RepID=A0A7Y9ETZ0_9MICO|nr:AI-2E family transporter [Microbacterium pseudoresistens]NYD53927.1 putative PurR-regulated permease PerM [Microbacterium pseudoresistens]
MTSEHAGGRNADRPTAAERAAADDVVEAIDDANAAEASADRTSTDTGVETTDDGVPTRAPIIEPAPPRASFWTRIDRPFGFGFLLTLGALVALTLGFTVMSLSTVLIYIAFALFAALGLDPAVRFLERRGMSRPWAVVTVILGLIAVLALILVLIVPIIVSQIAAFVKAVPSWVDSFMASDVFAWLQSQFGDQVETITADLQKFLTDPGNIAAIGGGALQVGASIASGISGVIVVLVLTLYFVATLPTMKHWMLRLAPARNRPRASDITDQITDSVGGYVQGMVVLAFINAMLTLLLYSVLGLPFPPLMATVAFLITLIPLIGSVLFWVIGTSIALFVNPVGAIIFAVIYMIYMQIEAYVITPRVMNRAISVPGSLVVIGALAGGTLLGLLGALVAVPVAASVLIIIKQVIIPRQDARV